MKAFIGAVAAGLVLAAAPAAAQQAAARADTTRIDVERIVEESGLLPALEAVVAAATPELERTLEQLTQSLNALVQRVADDPELRAAAVRAARGGVEVAEVVVTEQTSVLVEALRAAAERIEAAAERPKR
jgi:hypothetical protein